MRPTFYRVSFPSNELNKIPELHRGFFLVCGHFSNELTANSIYHIFEKVTENSVEMTFIHNRFLVLVRHEMLKTYEFVRSYKSIIKKCERAGDHASVRMLRSLFHTVVEDFEGDKFSSIRNKTLAHYANDEYESAFVKAASSGKNFSYLMGDYIGENVFNFIDDIIVEHFTDADPVDGKNIFDYIRDEMATYRFTLLERVHIYMRETLDKAEIDRNIVHEFAKSNSFTRRGSTEIPVLVARMEN